MHHHPEISFCAVKQERDVGKALVLVVPEINRLPLIDREGSESHREVAIAKLPLDLLARVLRPYWYPGQLANYSLPAVMVSGEVRDRSIKPRLEVGQ